MICDDPMVHRILKHGRSPVRYPAHYVQSYNLQIPANIGILLISGMPGRPCDKVAPHLSDSAPISITGECWTMAHDEEL